LKTAWSLEVQRPISSLHPKILLDSRFAEAYNDRGVLRHLRGDVTAAIGDYDAALRLKPRFAKAWMNRGIRCHSVCYTRSSTLLASDCCCSTLYH
jgi:lipoprotein NlpI